MGKYYCDYCDIYLTHDSMNARKAHNTGRNHVSNVRDYFASMGHDKAQNIIDQIVQQHETGGRAVMMAAPSMRLGAGFMNPMMPGMNGPPPFPPGGMPPPPFRPPFAPTGAPPPNYTGPPPQFAPASGGMGGGAGGPGGMPPFPPPNMGGGMGMGMGGMPPPSAAAPNGMGAPPPMGMGGPNGPPPPSFTPMQGPPAAGQPGVHPDRLRMMGI